MGKHPAGDPHKGDPNDPDDKPARQSPYIPPNDPSTPGPRFMATNAVADILQGNPLAAGLIAFGAGLLASSLIPPSEKEREAAESLKSAAEPVKTQLTDAAKDVAQGLKEPAQEAMENVKATATDAAQTVKEEGQAAASEVKDSAADAKDHVQNT
jgi:gas vesicle protein